MVKDNYVNSRIYPSDNSMEAYVGRNKEDNTDIIAVDIVHKLKIGKDDRILDACCGNGLLTFRIVPVCTEIVGIDFSKINIKAAKGKMRGSNISYIFGNALEVDKYFEKHSFDKIFCYFALQYFDSNKGRKLIEKLLSVCRPGGQILIGDIPDYNRRWTYYNTIPKK